MPGPGMFNPNRMAAPALEDQLKQLERLLESPVVKRYLELIEENANLRAQVEINERMLKMERELRTENSERERGSRGVERPMPPEARPNAGREVQQELMELRQLTQRLREEVERARMAEREKDERNKVEREKAERSKDEREKAERSKYEREKAEREKAEAKRKEKEANKKGSDKKESD